MNDAFQGALPDYTQVWISPMNRNARAAATIVPSYLRPSDAYTITDVLGLNPPAPGSYAGNIGWVRQNA
jgi:hypothetical protein